MGIGEITIIRVIRGVIRIIRETKTEGKQRGHVILGINALRKVAGSGILGTSRQVLIIALVIIDRIVIITVSVIGIFRPKVL